MTIIGLCTNNQKKVVELQPVFEQLSLDVKSYADVVGQTIDVVEDGLTYEENAAKKIEAMPAQDSVIWVSDDSGMEVDALGGDPGIYSARFGGEGLTDIQRCDLILEKLGDQETRNAKFVCVIAYQFPGQPIQCCRGEVEGRIALERTGDKGFGYDPIFIPNGHNQTFAVLSKDIKQTISHRARALTQLVSIIKSAQHLQLS